MENKPREFWIRKDLASVFDADKIGIVEQAKPDFIHVIEHSAYAALKAENEKFRKAVDALTNGYPSEWAYTILKKERDELRAENEKLMAFNLKHNQQALKDTLRIDELNLRCLELEKALKHAQAAMTYAYEDRADQYYLNVKEILDKVLVSFRSEE